MNFFKNYISTLVFIALGYIFYSHNEQFLNFSSGILSFDFSNFSITITPIFYSIIFCYILGLIPFYLYYPGKSKARILIHYIGKVMQGHSIPTQQEQTALLSWIVKLFFAPLMIVWLGQHIFTLINMIYGSYQNIELFSSNFLVFFNTYFFMMAFSAILFFDVLFFTLGYLLEAPFLKNTIKSVEPTIIGWAVAILCYPPFNNNVTQLVGWYSRDFPHFNNPYFHIILNVSILLLMGIYAWASITLGFKASNLTNRGIITTGPYKYVRHPAYVCKNIAWLIGGLPILFVSFSSNQISTFSVFIGLSAWAFLYYMRAMTEEAHLSLDPEYLIYKKNVPYKFIPKIW